ncbi:MAG: glycosyltransferase family 1 protein [Gemmatimonadales bacterium]|nr:MAG: glycosyltransferase family 1 protein [Gemmatimonadales bacterium]
MIRGFPDLLAVGERLRDPVVPHDGGGEVVVVRSPDDGIGKEDRGDGPPVLRSPAEGLDPPALRVESEEPGLLVVVSGGHQDLVLHRVVGQAVDVEDLPHVEGMAEFPLRSVAGAPEDPDRVRPWVAPVVPVEDPVPGIRGHAVFEGCVEVVRRSRQRLEGPAPVFGTVDPVVEHEDRPARQHDDIAGPPDLANPPREGVARHRVLQVVREGGLPLGNRPPALEGLAHVLADVEEVVLHGVDPAVANAPYREPVDLPVPAGTEDPGFCDLHVDDPGDPVMPTRDPPEGDHQHGEKEEHDAGQDEARGLGVPPSAQENSGGLGGGRFGDRPRDWPDRSPDCSLRFSSHTTHGVRVKVLHVMAPSPMGGAEQVVLDLTRAQAAAGAEVHLVAILGEGEEDHAFLAGVGPGVGVHPVHVPHRAYLAERRAIRERIRALGASVVHTHGYRADVLGGSAARSEGVPLVGTVHGFTGGDARNRFYEWLQRRAYRKFDRVVAVSEVLASELGAGALDRSRIVTIGNARSRPADLADPAAARHTLGAPADAFHVGWIGRMSHEKAPDLMLEALRILSEGGRVPTLHATMIGDGRERAALQARTGELGLGDRIRWPGGIAGAASLLRGFDVVAMSSRTEGTPIVALEAMITGVPLVATRVGGIPALAGEEAALLVPPEDPEALAAAIESVHAGPAAAGERADLARRRMDEIAAPARWAEQYLDLYRGIPGLEGGG